MALSIMNNSTALGAMGSLNTANTKLSKTIAQLSSGFRINSAADDASGLAVSEKLRGQISGLGKAASNAQDAISMLQTAEGAMGSMTSIVQRMRELAVQAGDPAYTTNDRAMLQLEVDQLKEEINRVSSSTEFNTKKLLNGDAAALWSASNGELEAIIKGTPAEGNYKLSYNVDPGKNAVYKTDIMSIKAGGLSYDMTANGTAITKIDNMSGMLRTADNPLSVEVSVISAAYSVAKMGYSGTGFSGTITFSSTVTSSYTMEIETTSARSAAGTATAQFRIRNAKTGELSDWISATIDSDGVMKAIASASITNVAGITGNLYNVTAGVTLGDVTYSSGAKALVAFSAAANTDADDMSIRIGNGTAGATVTYLQSELISDDYSKTTKVYTAQMDQAGNVYYGNMDVTFGKGASITTAAATLASLTVLGEGDLASKFTKLGDIARFVNADGRNVLDNTQELTIYGGNGKQAVITLEGSDTVKDLEDKLTSAIIDQLGLGADITNANAANVNNNLVNFVETATANSNEAVEGTFVIQSALLGKNSEISFSGDQGVIDALSIANIQAATDSALTVRVIDAHTGDFIGQDTVTDGRLRGVIDGVDVDINPASAADVDYVNGKMVFTAKADDTEAFLHIVDNSTKAAIGANEGQIIDLSIGRLDTKSLELDEVNVVTFDNAQASITKLDQALEKISKARATVGAQMNRLDYTINNLNTAKENLTASESRIRDLDIAQASTDLASRQVLLQSATAMLAQANTLPTYAAQLLR